MTQKCEFFKQTITVPDAYHDHKVHDVIGSAIRKIIKSNDTNVEQEVKKVETEIEKLKNNDVKEPKGKNKTNESPKTAKPSLTPSNSTSTIVAQVYKIEAEPSEAQPHPQNLATLLLNTVVITISVVVLLAILSLVIYQKFYVMPRIDISSKESLKLPLLGVLRSGKNEEDPLMTRHKSS